MKLIVVDRTLTRRATELHATALRLGGLHAGLLARSIPTDEVEFRARFNEQAALLGVDPLPKDWRWPPLVVVVGRRSWWRRLRRWRPG